MEVSLPSAVARCNATHQKNKHVTFREAESHREHHLGVHLLSDGESRVSSGQRSTSVGGMSTWRRMKFFHSDEDNESLGAFSSPHSSFHPSASRSLCGHGFCFSDSERTPVMRGLGQPEESDDGASCHSLDMSSNLKKDITPEDVLQWRTALNAGSSSNLCALSASRPRARARRASARHTGGPVATRKRRSASCLSDSGSHEMSEGVSFDSPAFEKNWKLRGGGRFSRAGSQVTTAVGGGSRRFSSASSFAPNASDVDSAGYLSRDQTRRLSQISGPASRRGSALRRPVAESSALLEIPLPLSLEESEEDETSPQQQQQQPKGRGGIRRQRGNQMMHPRFVEPRRTEGDSDGSDFWEPGRLQRRRARLRNRQKTRWSPGGRTILGERAVSTQEEADDYEEVGGDSAPSDSPAVSFAQPLVSQEAPEEGEEGAGERGENRGREGFSSPERVERRRRALRARDPTPPVPLTGDQRQELADLIAGGSSDVDEPTAGGVEEGEKYHRVHFGVADRYTDAREGESPVEDGEEKQRRRASVRARIPTPFTSLGRGDLCRLREEAAECERREREEAETSPPFSLRFGAPPPPAIAPSSVTFSPVSSCAFEPDISEAQRTRIRRRLPTPFSRAFVRDLDLDSTPHEGADKHAHGAAEGHPGAAADYRRVMLTPGSAARRDGFMDNGDTSFFEVARKEARREAIRARLPTPFCRLSVSQLRSLNEAAEGFSQKVAVLGGERENSAASHMKEQKVGRVRRDRAEGGPVVSFCSLPPSVIGSDPTDLYTAGRRTLCREKIRSRASTPMTRLSQRYEKSGVRLSLSLIPGSETEKPAEPHKHLTVEAEKEAGKSRQRRVKFADTAFRPDLCFIIHPDDLRFWDAPRVTVRRQKLRGRSTTPFARVMGLPELRCARRFRERGMEGRVSFPSSPADLVTIISGRDAEETADSSTQQPLFDDPARCAHRTALLLARTPTPFRDADVHLRHLQEAQQAGKTHVPGSHATVSPDSEIPSLAPAIHPDDPTFHGIARSKNRRESIRSRERTPLRSRQTDLASLQSQVKPVLHVLFGTETEIADEAADPLFKSDAQRNARRRLRVRQRQRAPSPYVRLSEEQEKMLEEEEGDTVGHKKEARFDRFGPVVLWDSDPLFSHPDRTVRRRLAIGTRRKTGPTFSPFGLKARAGIPSDSSSVKEKETGEHDLSAVVTFAHGLPSIIAPDDPLFYSSQRTAERRKGIREREPSPWPKQKPPPRNPAAHMRGRSPPPSPPGSDDEGDGDGGPHPPPSRRRIPQTGTESASKPFSSAGQLNEAVEATPGYDVVDGTRVRISDRSTKVIGVDDGKWDRLDRAVDRREAIRRRRRNPTPFHFPTAAELAAAVDDGSNEEAEFPPGTRTGSKVTLNLAPFDSHSTSEYDCADRQMRRRAAIRARPPTPVSHPAQPSLTMEEEEGMESGEEWGRCVTFTDQPPLCVPPDDATFDESSLRVEQRRNVIASRLPTQYVRLTPRHLDEMRREEESSQAITFSPEPPVVLTGSAREDQGTRFESPERHEARAARIRARRPTPHARPSAAEVAQLQAEFVTIYTEEIEHQSTQQQQEGERQRGQPPVGTSRLPAQLRVRQSSHQSGVSFSPEPPEILGSVANSDWEQPARREERVRRIREREPTRFVPPMTAQQCEALERAELGEDEAGVVRRRGGLSASRSLDERAGASAADRGDGVVVRGEGGDGTSLQQPDSAPAQGPRSASFQPEATDGESPSSAQPGSTPVNDRRRGGRGGRNVAWSAQVQGGHGDGDRPSAPQLAAKERELDAALFSLSFHKPAESEREKERERGRGGVRGLRTACSRSAARSRSRSAQSVRSHSLHGLSPSASALLSSGAAGSPTGLSSSSPQFQQQQQPQQQSFIQSPSSRQGSFLDHTDTPHPPQHTRHATVDTAPPRELGPDESGGFDVPERQLCRQRRLRSRKPTGPQVLSAEQQAEIAVLQLFDESAEERGRETENQSPAAAAAASGPRPSRSPRRRPEGGVSFASTVVERPSQAYADADPRFWGHARASERRRRVRGRRASPLFRLSSAQQERLNQLDEQGDDQAANELLEGLGPEVANVRAQVRRQADLAVTEAGAEGEDDAAAAVDALQVAEEADRRAASAAEVEEPESEMAVMNQEDEDENTNRAVSASASASSSRRPSSSFPSDAVASGGASGPAAAAYGGGGSLVNPLLAPWMPFRLFSSFAGRRETRGQRGEGQRQTQERGEGEGA
uniref:Uncharacterized protein n=1 Tax=Chromera velia CCMP2878 TaxID=1169474 RepID=A0A0G4G5B8_9ALVE|eukprot:Cvel_20316.t1-p1 / transcript=Cvel_20316.t1 / gene=Cvel_20316 / organism=Chromera_velia_CCMP2878 / gene_product=hypothetical protein / transcript_product=hypothetical protein / location=Cvel_scaffold1814:10109-17796(+) / protein_length=2239 / sequence_SO=supercontig / SO=protein_coding / is_pseudo=false